VQLTREQEHAWEPKGTAQLMDVNGGLNADGSIAGYDFATRYPSNGAPTLALLLTGAIPHTPVVFEMGDRTAIPPYDYDNLRVVERPLETGTNPQPFDPARIQFQAPSVLLPGLPPLQPNTGPAVRRDGLAASLPPDVENVNPLTAKRGSNALPRVAQDGSDG